MLTALTIHKRLEDARAQAQRDRHFRIAEVPYHTKRNHDRSVWLVYSIEGDYRGKTIDGWQPAPLDY